MFKPNDILMNLNLLNVVKINWLNKFNVLTDLAKSTKVIILACDSWWNISSGIM